MKPYKGYTLQTSRDPMFKYEIIDSNNLLQGRFQSPKQCRDYIDSVVDGTTMLTRDTRKF